jgi:tRNA threonylcarbamoyladenosine biosynthesis protein TsaE
MSGFEVETISKGWKETFQRGERLSALLKGGDIVALFGDLGSGKTVFVQGVCSGLGVVQRVTSPSFILVREYTGRMPVFHFDFYRLDTLQDVAALDLDSYFDSGGISLIEWAGRGKRLLPRGHFQVYLNHVMKNGRPLVTRRRIRICGPADQKAAERLLL